MNDQWTNRLSEYLDGEMSGPEARALDVHLAGCAACRGALEELRRVVARAQTLADRPPATDLWPGIAARIGVSSGGRGHSPVVSLAERRAARRLVFSIPQAVAAGVALMLLSGGTAWLLLHQRSGTVPPITTSTPAPPVPEGTTVGWPTAESRYDVAIRELEQSLASGRGQLDSTTVRVLEKNLAVIDRAIAQARTALAADPASLYLNQHLADTMRRKLELLRRASTLATARS